MGKINDKTSCIDHIKITNIVSYNPSDICNAFAEHLASIWKNLAKDSLTKKILHDYISRIPRSKQSLYLNQTTEWEVTKLIK